MSSERIQHRLMRAGVDDEHVYAMSTPELINAMANVMLEAETAAAAVPAYPDPKSELQLQFELMRMQLKQRDSEHVRKMQLQREWFDGQLKMQMEHDRQAHEENQRKQVEREETLVAKAKRYGQAVQHALANMPVNAGELPAWFDMVDNVWVTFTVPEEHKKQIDYPETHHTCKITFHSFICS